MRIRHRAIKRARREERMALHPNKSTGKIITGHKAIPLEQLRPQGGTDLARTDEIDHEGASKYRHHQPMAAQETEVETTPDRLYALTLAQAQHASS